MVEPTTSANTPISKKVALAKCTCPTKGSEKSKLWLVRKG